MTPFVEAIDELASSATDYVPLPALAQLNWGSRRLDTSLRPPPHSVDTQFIEVQCFLDASFVNRDGLEEAANRDTMLAVAPLRPDLQAIVNSDERLHSRVVPAALDPSGIAATRARVQATLEYGLLNRRATSNTTQPLRHNPAKGFPLNNPFLARYFHVYRSSVRDLLRAFERATVSACGAASGAAVRQPPGLIWALRPAVRPSSHRLVITPVRFPAEASSTTRSHLP